MRLTEGPTGELRLRRPTPSWSGFPKARARQPHSGLARQVPAVEDGYVGPQEDIAENPEGPCRRRHVEGLEARQAEAETTPNNLDDVVLSREVKPDPTKEEGDGGQRGDCLALDEVLRERRNKWG